MITLELVLTTQCNLQCRYCFEHHSFAQHKQMSLEIALSAVKFSLDMCMAQHDPTLSIIFFGGEPLLMFPLIQEIVNYTRFIASHNIDIRFSISSNGLLLNEEIAKFLAENAVTMQLSIDGTPECQDRNRIFSTGDGTSSYFPKIFEYVDYYISKAVARPIFKMVVSPSNVDLFYQSIRFLCRPNCVVSYDIDFETKWTQASYDIYWEQLNMVIKDYNNIRQSNSTIEEVERFLKTFSNNGNPLIANICKAGTSHFAIDPNGDIFPCSRFLGKSNWCLGNLHDITQKLFIDPQTDATQGFSCAKLNCLFFPSCECKCLYVNQLKTGDIYNPSELQCLFQRSFFYACLKHIPFLINPNA